MLEDISKSQNVNMYQYMHSAAISLKRIADALERLQVAPRQPVMMHADEYAKYMEMKDAPTTNVGDIVFNKS